MLYSAFKGFLYFLPDRQGGGTWSASEGERCFPTVLQSSSIHTLCSDGQLFPRAVQKHTIHMKIRKIRKTVFPFLSTSSSQWRNCCVVLQKRSLQQGLVPGETSTGGCHFLASLQSVSVSTTCPLPQCWAQENSLLREVKGGLNSP